MKQKTIRGAISMMPDFKKQLSYTPGFAFANTVA